VIDPWQYCAILTKNPICNMAATVSGERLLGYGNITGSGWYAQNSTAQLKVNTQ